MKSRCVTFRKVRPPTATPTGWCAPPMGQTDHTYAALSRAFNCSFPMEEVPIGELPPFRKHWGHSEVMDCDTVCVLEFTRLIAVPFQYGMGIRSCGFKLVGFIVPQLPVLTDAYSRLNRVPFGATLSEGNVEPPELVG
ncbi:hypothetical protein M514_02521 [Trichuris suis]|uniref:Uncharacterized protein n=1 Tax=Trichuris suis TaxID=68888 RepID=A0A085NN99_9BILA|nr:hypothetical protein M514_02521 [Trichuris suis]